MESIFSRQRIAAHVLPDEMKTSGLQDLIAVICRFQLKEEPELIVRDEMNLIRAYKKLYVRVVFRFLRIGVIAGSMVTIAGSFRVHSNDVGIRTGSYSTNGFSRQMLTAHNNIRIQAKLPPLQWSVKLAAYAQRWANLLLAKNGTGHNPRSPYGENIFISGKGVDAEDVVMEWASESRDYSYRTNSCSTDCGHYTQLVWRETQRVGCAVASNSRRTIWVCSYDPPGNNRGEWPY